MKTERERERKGRTMAKKDFSKVNTGGVYETIAAATSETEQTFDTQENTKKRKTHNVHDIHDTTSDKQSGKLQRINMAFYDDVYAYIKCMARVSGITMKDFCNTALRQHMEDHGDIYRKALEFRNSL